MATEARFPIFPYAGNDEIGVEIVDNGTEGNLYVYIDGLEYGSLFFARNPDGTIEVTLGQFDVELQQWKERNPIKVLPTEYQIPRTLRG